MVEGDVEGRMKLDRGTAPSFKGTLANWPSMKGPGPLTQVSTPGSCQRTAFFTAAPHRVRVSCLSMLTPRSGQRTTAGAYPGSTGAPVWTRHGTWRGCKPWVACHPYRGDLRSSSGGQHHAGHLPDHPGSRVPSAGEAVR